MSRIFVVFILIAITSSVLYAGEEDFIFDLQKQYRFLYKKNNLQIAYENFTFENVIYNNQTARRLKCEFSMGDDYSFQKGNSAFTFTVQGKPLLFEKTLQVKLPSIPQKNGLYKMHYTFYKESVEVKASKDGQTLIDATLPGGQNAGLIDNNALALFALACTVLKGLPREKEIKAFHASNLQVMKVKFVKAGVDNVTIDRKKHLVGKYKVTINNMGIGFFYITGKGKLVKDYEPRQNLMIDLVE